VRAAWDGADAAYMRTLKVARVALRGNPKARAAAKVLKTLLTPDDANG